jgi:hypothetical protein
MVTAAPFDSVEVDSVVLVSLAVVDVVPEMEAEADADASDLAEEIAELMTDVTAAAEALGVLVGVGEQG